MRTKSKVVYQKPPADFDEVKRRFIRQNRELAKSNSNQSLRIRNLETEVSRLSAELLHEREERYRVQRERDGAVSGAFAQFKEAFQAKILEMSGLVAGMELPKMDCEVGEDRLPKRMEGPWIERQSLTEIMRDNQMPTIGEYKSYPRRTLEADEVQAIRLSDQSSNESPDIGPPPVAHFDYEDPVKQISPSVNHVSPQTQEDAELATSLSVNLETRRKRRDGQPKLEIRRHSILAQSPTKTDPEASSILRTGAKRKLGDREMDRAIKPPSKDDFTFARKSVSSEKNPLPLSVTNGEGEILPPSPSRQARKVLGDKSVNHSPRKPSATVEKPGQGKESDAKASSSRSSGVRSQTRTRRASAIPTPMPQDDVLSTAEIAPPPGTSSVDMPPKTPAAPDIFSPTPSEPSAKPAESRDTPPPSDLSTLSTSVEEGARPSRRARNAVSYTEPSLVAKLRRPSKQMVDALSGLQDPRCAMSVPVEKKASQTVTVKAEPVDDDAWKSLPAAEVEPDGPVNGKISSVGLDAVLPVDEAVSNTLSSAATESSSIPPTTIIIPSSSVAGKKRTASATQAPSKTLGLAMKGMESLDIYDFKGSSSPTDDAVPDKATTISAMRAQRRHSSLRPTLNASSTSVGKVDGFDSLPPAAAAPGRSERTASRRRSMML